MKEPIRVEESNNSRYVILYVLLVFVILIVSLFVGFGQTESKPETYDIKIVSKSDVIIFKKSPYPRIVVNETEVRLNGEEIIDNIKDFLEN